MELIPGIEPGRRPYQGRRLPLHQISVGANGGTRTRTSRLGRPAGTITPHSPWFGLWYQSLIPRPNADRWRSPAQELLSVVKDPTLASWFGDSARIRTRTHEVWRLGCCRYTTLSFLFHVSTVSETKPPRDLTRAFCRASDQKQKRPSRGSPQKACFSMNAGPLGRFPLRIEHAAIGAIDPDRGHGSTHTGSDSRGAGQIEWPS